MGCLVTVVEPKIYTHVNWQKYFSRASLDNYRGFSLGNCEISPFLFSFCPLTLPLRCQRPPPIPTSVCFPSLSCSAPPAMDAGYSHILHDCSPELPSLPCPPVLTPGVLYDWHQQRKEKINSLARGRPWYLVWSRVSHWLGVPPRPSCASGVLPALTPPQGTSGAKHWCNMYKGTLP